MVCVGLDGTHGMAYGTGTGRADQCAGIWCMAHVGPDGTHGMAYGAGIGCIVMELDRRGRRVL